MDDFQVDVLVVGAGNAAACAALAAREKGASVAMLEAAPEEERGGNSTYTAGAMRVVFHGVDDLVQLYDLTEDEKRDVDFGSYSADQFLDDMGRVTNYRCDPELTDILIGRSFETLKWMRTKGVRFQPSYGRQAFKVNGKYKFWGGLAVEAWGGGPGLVDLEHKAAVKAGIPIHYETAAVSLIEEDGVVRGVIARHKGRKVRIGAKAVVLACGGFESNAEMRTRYLGPTWDLAKVRGTRFNTGAGINMALAIGAKPHGNWSGGHAVGWDMNAPEFGDLEVGDNFQKHSYPLGIMVNANGVRFVDEGADFRNYTYAKYGAVILAQPQQFAWQIFDSKVLDKLRDEYRIKRMTKVRADTIEELATKLEGVDQQQFLKTIKEWNAAVMTEVPFNPGGQGRPRRARARRAEEQLGQHDRPGAVRGLRRDLRPHLHLRRAEDHQRGRGREHRRQHHSRPVRRRRAGRRAVLSQLPRRHGPGIRRRAGQAGGRRRRPLRLGQELVLPDRGPPGPMHIHERREASMALRMPAYEGESNDQHHPPPRPRARLDRPPPALAPCARRRPGRTGPVTFVVGYAAGGSADINARELAQLMSPVIGQQIIIDNKGGAAGSIGLRAVAAAKPDGQTLFCRRRHQRRSSTRTSRRA